MFLSKRTPIIIGIVAAVLVIGIAAAVIYDRQLRAPEPDKAVPPTKFYDLNLDDISAVRLQNGSNGSIKTLNTKEELEHIVSLLNRVEYDTVKALPETQGWSWSITIYSSSGDTKALYSNTVSTHTIEGGQAKRPNTVYTYFLTPESVPIMEDIISLMPE